MASNQHHHSNSHPRQQPPNENNNRPPVANRQQSHNHHKNSSSNHSNHAHDKPANHYQNQNARPVRKKTTPPYFNEKPIFTCVLCCQDFPSARHRAVFAIGACNHMICYYCSTKMRVLCEQSECPTCRQELSEVIFTTNKDMKFTKLETKRCIEYNSRFKIYFENETCLAEFHRLQEVRCQICASGQEENDETLFANLRELESHLKRAHDRYLCDLCVSHLKVFPNERKHYNRKDLVRHRETGDPDTGVRGHRTCALCVSSGAANAMFFDDDDLLAHLKRAHYNCHFCQATTKMYFDNYASLKAHFIEKHFICEEGFCKDEEITSAFASRFDLAAHKASVHGSGKVNRNMVVDLELDFRGAGSEAAGGLPGAAGPVATGANRSNRNRRNNYQQHDPDDPDAEETAAARQLVPTQDDFPQLAASSAATAGSASNYAIMAKNVTGLKKSNFQNLKFKPPTAISEDFPALAPGTSAVPSFAQKKLATVRTKPQLFAKKQPEKKSDQQSMASLKYADIASSFPPLAQHSVNEQWSKPLPAFTQDDFPDMPIKVKKTKKKTQYINVQKEAAAEAARKAKEAAEEEAARKAKEEDVQPPNPLTNDGKMLSLKVPPGLHKLTQARNPPPGFQPHAAGNGATSSSFDMNTLSNMASELIQSENNKAAAAVATANRRARPKNGEEQQTNRSRDRNEGEGGNADEDANGRQNLASSSRTGYVYPSNFNERNELLLKSIRSELRTEHKFDQFKCLTDKFIRNHCDANFYFKKCLELFDRSFLSTIFGELLVLMPHIKKQTEILAAYERYFNYNKGAMQRQSKSDNSKGVWILTNEKLEFLVCPNCGQVLKRDGKDGPEHIASHSSSDPPAQN